MLETLFHFEFFQASLRNRNEAERYESNGEPRHVSRRQQQQQHVVEQLRASSMDSEPERHGFGSTKTYPWQHGGESNRII